MKCFVSNYVKKEVLNKLNQRMEQMEKLFDTYPDMETKSNVKRLDHLKQAFKEIDDIEVCDKKEADDGTAYNLTDEEEQKLKDRSDKIKKEPKEKEKKPRKRSDYQQHMSDCMKGSGPYDGEGRSEFTECVTDWKVRKELKK